MRKNKNSLCTIGAFYSLMLSLIILFGSCSKKENTVEPVTGEVKMDVSVVVDNFSEGMLNNKLASTYSYDPDYTSTIDFNQDYILEARLSSGEPNSTFGSSLLKSNKQAAVTPFLLEGYVFKLLVFDAKGNIFATRDYTRGQEQLTPQLLLPKNTPFTFVCYSLNSSNMDSLNHILQCSSTTDTTLSNTSLVVQGNQDLLFFKKELITTSNDSGNLNIALKHQFNLLTTTINADETGYDVGPVEAVLTSDFNSAQLNLGDQTIVHLPRVDSISYSNFSYRAGTSSQSIATSNALVFNAKPGEKLLKIRKLTVGTITNTSPLVPFLQGVLLESGKQYNLNVRLVPKDSLYTLNSGSNVYQVARINGKVWMRHNLGANYSANPDIIGTAILGDYYQWGQNIPFASGTAQNSDKSKIEASAGYSKRAFTSINDFTVWNKGTDENPIKGDKDPCPTGFRLPTYLEYQDLIAATTHAYQGTASFSIPEEEIVDNFASTNYSFGVQLISRRKKGVLLTFPAQGYANIAGTENTTNSYGFGGFIGRGREVDNKTSSYVSKGTVTATNNSSVQLQVFEYRVFESINNRAPTIYTGPPGGRTSAFAIGNPVRCIAENPNQKPAAF